MQAHGGQHEEVILPPFVQVPVPILASTNTYPHADVLLDNCSSAPVKLSTCPIFDNSLLPTQTNFPALPVIFLNDSTLSSPATLPTVPEEHSVESDASNGSARRREKSSHSELSKQRRSAVRGGVSAGTPKVKKNPAESSPDMQRYAMFNNPTPAGVRGGVAAGMSRGKAESRSFAATMGNGTFIQVTTLAGGVLIMEMYRRPAQKWDD